MRWGLLILGLVTAASVAAAQAPPATAADETAVRDLVRRFTEARMRSDAKALEALLTADVDQYTSAGEWRRGVARVVQGMIETSARNPGTRAIEVAAIRFLTADIAVVDGGYTAGADARQLWTTLIIKRDSPGWRIAGIRNVSPTASTR